MRIGQGCHSLLQSDCRHLFSVSASLLIPTKKLLGPAFKGQQKEVIAAIEGLDDDSIVALQHLLAESNTAKVPGTEFEITRDHVAFRTEKKMIMERKYTPSVIEPSFGIGRVLYAVLEHAFFSTNWIRTTMCDGI